MTKKLNYEKAVKNIRTELKNYLKENNIKSIVLGVSGGIDSCLSAALARPVCDELGIPLIGRSLPISTNAPEEIQRAKLTGKVFCTNFEEVNLGELYVQFSAINSRPEYLYEMKNDAMNPTMDLTEESKAQQKSWKIRNGNIKARTRMVYLYNLASERNGMVLSTDNYTELMLGFWTLHGDVGDYGMIQNLYKSEVYDMAEWIAENECTFLDEQEAIKSTIEALATDGLGVTSLGDLGQILPEWKGSSRDGYKEVDRILKLWLERNELGDMQKMIIENPYKNHPVIQRHLGTDFKRNNPYNIPRNIIEA